MLLTPFPTQISGAVFLANNRNALLADAPRVGKTGTAIMACDYNLEDTILVLTTASGRAVWQRAFNQWSGFGRGVQVMLDARPITKPVVIVGWPAMANAALRVELLKRRWSRLILDEGHNAKNFDAKRTQAVYGVPVEDGAILADTQSLVAKADGTWVLTGTPIPNAPNDLYPMMRALCPDRLLADDAKGWPDVTKYQTFLHRYCVVKMKKISNFNRIPVVIGGRNLPELAERVGDFMLLRTQQDVGIREPIYETFPLVVSPAMLRSAEGDLDRTSILDAAVAGDTRKLDMHLGPLRRITGAVVAKAVVEAVREEFENGLDKIVLAYWHREVGDILREGLHKYGVLQIDGSTPGSARGEIEQEFLNSPAARVMLGQIQAAGEAVDFSSAAELLFVETSLVPKDMAQMSKRITNHTQKRQPRVRVAVLQGSIQEALEEVLLRKWTAIRGVLSK